MTETMQGIGHSLARSKISEVNVPVLPEEREIFKKPKIGLQNLEFIGPRDVLEGPLVFRIGPLGLVVAERDDDPLDWKSHPQNRD